MQSGWGWCLRAPSPFIPLSLAADDETKHINSDPDPDSDSDSDYASSIDSSVCSVCSLLLQISIIASGTNYPATVLYCITVCTSTVRVLFLPCTVFHCPLLYCTTLHLTTSSYSHYTIPYYTTYTHYIRFSLCSPSTLPFRRTPPPPPSSTSHSSPIIYSTCARAHTPLQHPPLTTH